MNNTIIELLLWDNCCNSCSFCPIKHGSIPYAPVSVDQQAKALEAAAKYLSSDKFPDDSDVLLCGGELFDTPLNRLCQKSLNMLEDSVSSLLRTGKIHTLLLNTNLIYDMSLSLLPFLEYLDQADVITKVKVTTSYDLVGRYKTVADKKLVQENLQKLRNKYTALYITANMVLTKPVCNLIVDGYISVPDISNFIGVPINVIPYIVVNKVLAPSPDLLFKAIDTLDKQIPNFIETFVTRFKNERPRLLFKYTGDKLENRTALVGSCGHSINFTRYSDSGSCFICDLINRYKDCVF